MVVNKLVEKILTNVQKFSLRDWVSRITVIEGNNNLRDNTGALDVSKVNNILFSTNQKEQIDNIIGVGANNTKESMVDNLKNLHPSILLSENIPVKFTTEVIVKPNTNNFSFMTDCKTKYIVEEEFIYPTVETNVKLDIIGSEHFSDYGSDYSQKRIDNTSRIGFQLGDYITNDGNRIPGVDSATSMPVFNRLVKQGFDTTALHKIVNDIFILLNLCNQNALTLKKKDPEDYYLDGSKVNSNIRYLNLTAYQGANAVAEALNYSSQVDDIAIFVPEGQEELYGQLIKLFNWVETPFKVEDRLNTRQFYLGSINYRNVNKRKNFYIYAKYPNLVEAEVNKISDDWILNKESLSKVRDLLCYLIPCRFSSYMGDVFSLFEYSIHNYKGNQVFFRCPIVKLPSVLGILRVVEPSNNGFINKETGVTDHLIYSYILKQRYLNSSFSLLQTIFKNGITSNDLNSFSQEHLTSTFEFNKFDTTRGATIGDSWYTLNNSNYPTPTLMYFAPGYIYKTIENDIDINKYKKVDSNRIEFKKYFNIYTLFGMSQTVHNVLPGLFIEGETIKTKLNEFSMVETSNNHVEVFDTFVYNTNTNNGVLTLNQNSTYSICLKDSQGMYDFGPDNNQKSNILSKDFNIKFVQKTAELDIYSLSNKQVKWETDNVVTTNLFSKVITIPTKEQVVSKQSLKYMTKNPLSLITTFSRCSKVGNIFDLIKSLDIELYNNLRNEITNKAYKVENPSGSEGNFVIIHEGWDEALINKLEIIFSDIPKTNNFEFINCSKVVEEFRNYAKEPTFNKQTEEIQTEDDDYQDIEVKNNESWESGDLIRPKKTDTNLVNETNKSVDFSKFSKSRIKWSKEPDAHLLLFYELDTDLKYYLPLKIHKIIEQYREDTFVKLQSKEQCGYDTIEWCIKNTKYKTEKQKQDMLQVIDKFRTEKPKLTYFECLKLISENYINVLVINHRMGCEYFKTLNYTGRTKVEFILYFSREHEHICPINLDKYELIFELLKIDSLKLSQYSKLRDGVGLLDLIAVIKRTNYPVKDAIRLLLKNN